VITFNGKKNRYLMPAQCIYMLRVVLTVNTDTSLSHSDWVYNEMGCVLCEVQTECILNHLFSGFRVQLVFQRKSPVSMAGRSVWGLCLTEPALALPFVSINNITPLLCNPLHPNVVRVQAVDVRRPVNREAFFRTPGIIEQGSTLTFVLRRA